MLRKLLQHIENSDMVILPALFKLRPTIFSQKHLFNIAGRILTGLFYPEDKMRIFAGGSFEAFDLSHGLWWKTGSGVTATDMGLRLQDGGGVSVVRVTFLSGRRAQISAHFKMSLALLSVAINDLWQKRETFVGVHSCEDIHLLVGFGTCWQNFNVA